MGNCSISSDTRHTMGGASESLFFLHGFLGDPSDWNEVIAYLPEYSCTPLSYPFHIPDEGVLIGYSMGGRIALSSPLPKILISAHLGLSTQSERDERRQQEQQWYATFAQLSLREALPMWYGQPLFHSLTRHPSFPQIYQRRLQQSREVILHQLVHHPLSQSSWQTPVNTVLVCGELDSKYRALYSKVPTPNHCIPGVGHAAHLTEPYRVATLIKNIMFSTRVESVIGTNNSSK